MANQPNEYKKDVNPNEQRDRDQAGKQQPFQKDQNERSKQPGQQQNPDMNQKR